MLNRPQASINLRQASPFRDWHGILSTSRALHRQWVRQLKDNFDIFSFESHTHYFLSDELTKQSFLVLHVCQKSVQAIETKMAWITCNTWQQKLHLAWEPHLDKFSVFSEGRLKIWSIFLGPPRFVSSICCQHLHSVNYLVKSISILICIECVLRSLWLLDWFRFGSSTLAMLAIWIDCL